MSLAFHGLRLPSTERGTTSITQVPVLTQTFRPWMMSCRGSRQNHMARYWVPSYLQMFLRWQWTSESPEHAPCTAPLRAARTAAHLHRHSWWRGSTNCEAHQVWARSVHRAKAEQVRNKKLCQEPGSIKFNACQNRTFWVMMLTK